MTMNRAHVWGIGSIAALVLILNGCGDGPSYKRAEAAETIRTICANEYHLAVSARELGQTVAVHLHQAGLLQQAGGQIGLMPDAHELLGNLIEVIHRVLLSCDRPPGFYVVLLSDPTVPGAYVSMVRYLDDVRLVNANSIAPMEFFSRTVFELKFTAPQPITLETLPIHDLTLAQFLSSQLAQRIQNRLIDRVHEEGLSTVTVGQCEGVFDRGEFAFTVNVMPMVSAQLDEHVLQTVFEAATSVVAQVLSSYHFDGFEAVRLIHPATGRNLLLPKGRLEPFR